MYTNDKSNTLPYYPNKNRYQETFYKRCGNSGILLPKISLGLWHNFGMKDDLIKGREILRKAFDLGITHFDLANNYGPSYGAAETNFGQLFKEDFKAHRDELLISTKAGYDMWPGPYGNWGSKKYLIASLDQSLRRMGLDYVDIFYHHRPDPETPLVETMTALDQIVRQGKALYVGISNYPAAKAAEAFEILNELGTPCLIHQMKFSILNNEPSKELLPTLNKHQVGGIAFSPLAQGQLTNKYINGIPENSRASKNMTYLTPETIDQNLVKIKKLHILGDSWGLSLSQLALQWVLGHKAITSVLVGVSKVSQLEDNVKTANLEPLSADQMSQINELVTTT